MTKTTAIIMIALTLSACRLPFFSERGNDTNWQEEVLWANECGEEGLQCCPDRDPGCSYGLDCCTDPNDPERSLCRADCACGGEGQFCCAGDVKCSAELACYEGDCVKCGGEGEPCCDLGLTCSDALLCHKGLCQTCGQPGHPCCLSGQACIGDDGREQTRTECLKDTCVFCGGDGQIACQQAPNCNAGHLENNLFCYLCGAYNQPCCNASSSLGYECDPANGLSCQLGFCAN